MNNKRRIFFASFLPESVNNTLDTYVSHFNLKKLRVVPPRKRHITFFFLGDIPNEDLQWLQTQEISFAPLSMKIERYKTFYRQNIPSLLTLELTKTQELDKLSKQLRALFSNDQNKKSFNPHITWTYLRKDSLQECQRHATIWENLSDSFPPPWTSNRIDLILSFSKKEGTEYHSVRHWLSKLDRPSNDLLRSPYAYTL